MAIEYHCDIHNKTSNIAITKFHVLSNGGALASQYLNIENTTKYYQEDEIAVSIISGVSGVISTRAYICNNADFTTSGNALINISSSTLSIISPAMSGNDK